MQNRETIQANSIFLSENSKNWIKGLLIIFVVADHNDYYRIVANEFFRPLTFHVVGFFLLNFYGSFLSARNFKSFCLDRAVRYLWPFFIFYTIYALGARFIKGNVEISVYSYFSGLLFGSFDLVKAGCGGAFMWFLPALFGFSLLFKLLGQIKFSWLQIMLVVSFIFHIFVGSIFWQFKTYQPLGIAIALYLCPLVLFFFFLQSRFRIKLGVLSIFVLLLISGVIHFYLMRTGLNIEVGSLDVPSFDKLHIVAAKFLGDTALLAGVWAVANLVSPNGVLLQSIGKHSLLIYLLHPFFFMVFNLLLIKLNIGSSYLQASILGTASFLFSLLTPWYLALMLEERPNFSRYVFPRNVNEFFLYSFLMRRVN